MESARLLVIRVCDFISPVRFNPPLHRIATAACPNCAIYRRLIIDVSWYLCTEITWLLQDHRYRSIFAIRVFAKTKQKIVAIALPDNSSKWSVIFASSLSSFCNGVPGNAVRVASIHHRGRARVSVTAFVVLTFRRAVRCLGHGRTRLLIKVSASSPVNEVGYRK